MEKLDIKYIVGTVLRNIKFLATHRLNLEFQEYLFRAKDEALDDMVYEYEENKKNLRKFTILGEEEFVQLLQKQPKSFVRFGDGEVKLMRGLGQPFQKYDDKLVHKMYRIIQNRQDGLYIGLNKGYFQSNFHDFDGGRYNRMNGTVFRRFFLKNCYPDNTFFDAACTMAYFSYDETYDLEAHYERMKSLFEGRELLILSGKGVLEKLKYDVFERASRKKIIHGPSKHAFKVYDELLEKVKKNASQDSTTVCVILGMTGKAMVKDLTDCGYLVWDIGHMAKDYDYYMRHVTRDEAHCREFFAPD